LSVAWLLYKNTLYQKSNEGKQEKQISKKAWKMERSWKLTMKFKL
jgi:hypothetical protein